MFTSLKTKIIFLIIMIMAFTAIIIMFFTHRDVGNAMSHAEEVSAKNILRLVDLNIQGGYQKLISEQIDAMLQHKMDLKNQINIAVSVMEHYSYFSKKKIIPQKRARFLALKWIRSVNTSNTDLFVFNRNGIVLAHTDPSIKRMSIKSIKDIKGRTISDVMSESGLTSGGDFAVFLWKKKGEPKGSKKLGYFLAFPKWHWTIAAMIDISYIEAEAQKKQDKIIQVLKKTFSSIQIAETGYAILFNGSKEILIPPPNHDKRFKLIKNNLTGNLLLDDLMSSAYTDHKSLKYSGSFKNTNEHDMEAYTCYFKTLDWYITVAVPVSEIQKPAKTLVTRQSVIIIIIFLISLIIASFVIVQISRPLNMLANYARKLPKTDFSVEKKEKSPVDTLSVQLRDEVGRLAESFRFMELELFKNIRNLMETTAAKERIESELKIARDIQMGTLPKIFPPFPERTEFEIHALLEPAKEVGGDLYDFFFLDEDHLCLLVGDVSGKGVPASLFMVISKTIIKMKAAKNKEPDEILSEVNHILTLDNPSFMFVTIIFGILNIRTGEFVYSNGGHNPPLIIQNNGKPDRLELPEGLVLGVQDEYPFKSNRVMLEKGDILFLYTDGITEARNKKMDIFTEKRLIDDLNKLKKQPLPEIITGIMERINIFANEMPQEDDITMLTIKYMGT